MNNTQEPDSTFLIHYHGMRRLNIIDGVDHSYKSSVQILNIAKAIDQDTMSIDNSAVIFLINISEKAGSYTVRLNKIKYIPKSQNSYNYKLVHFLRLSIFRFLELVLSHYGFVVVNGFSHTAQTNLYFSCQPRGTQRYVD